jgi:hypothetical protein
MASRATRKILTTISMAHGVADSIRDSYADSLPKTPAAMIKRVHTCCRACFDLWPDELSRRELQGIADSINALEGTVQHRGKSEAVTITALSVMLLSDLADRLPNPEKRRAVRSLLAAMIRLNRYYDRRLDHWQAYRQAAKAVEILERKAA